MRVALIHDHLAQAGGAEKVLQVLAEMFPQATIFTLLYEPENAAKYFAGRSIYTSIIQRLPWGVKHYKWYLPFMSLAVEFFNLSDYDLVISDTSSFAKGVITPDKAPHICYCHTPTRYLWSDTHSYIEDLPYNKLFKKLIALSLQKIRLWDQAAAGRVDCFIANSHFIARRIYKYYKRESTVIYPPVAIDQFHLAAEVGDYFLAGGRLVPYKKFDLLIEAFRANGRQLKIFGDGPDEARLKKLAHGAGNIHFLGRVSETEKAELYARAQAFINPQEEDFGITMVEALASGRPVIAYDSGGAREIVADGDTGLLFGEQNADSLNAALQRFYQLRFSPERLRQWAQNFSVEKFKELMSAKIAQVLADYKKQLGPRN